jgi:hypothetical protein
MVCAVPDFLRIATAVVALLLAAWALYLVIRDRPPHTGLFAGVLVLEALAVALVVTAVVRLAGGHRTPDTATFIGYVAAFLVIPPAGLALARMEPTKWGSVIIVALGLVEAILVVRLQQVWTGA